MRINIKYAPLSLDNFTAHAAPCCAENRPAETSLNFRKTLQIRSPDHALRKKNYISISFGAQVGYPLDPLNTIVL